VPCKSWTTWQLLSDVLAGRLGFALHMEAFVGIGTLALAIATSWLALGVDTEVRARLAYENVAGETYLSRVWGPTAEESPPAGLAAASTAGRRIAGQMLVSLIALTLALAAGGALVARELPRTTSPSVHGSSAGITIPAPPAQRT